jgi:hypothetical protein
LWRDNESYTVQSASRQAPRRAASHSSRVSQPDAHTPVLDRDAPIVLPPWQPDEDVTHCFVCNTKFGFFYRKHHCRYVFLRVFSTLVCFIRNVDLPAANPASVFLTSKTIPTPLMPSPSNPFLSRH